MKYSSERDTYNFYKIREEKHNKSSQQVSDMNIFEKWAQLREHKLRHNEMVNSHMIN